MNEFTKVIEGKKVIRAIRIHDYHQIFFEGDFIFTINNPMEFSPKNLKFAAIEGLRLIRLIQQTDSVTFLFENGASVVVDLRESSWGGYPEAMKLNGPDIPILVWTPPEP